MRIFISWRHEDAPREAMHLFDAIEARLRPDKTFFDKASLVAGLPYREAIEDAVGSCDAVLAVIGPRWRVLLEAKAQSQELDYVELELAIALKRRIPVIPVHIDDTPFLNTDELPEPIAALAANQGVPLRNDLLHLHGDLGEIARMTEIAVLSGRNDPQRLAPEPEPEPEPEVAVATPAPPPLAPSTPTDGIEGAAAAGDDGRENECLRLGEAALREAEASGDEGAIARAGAAHALWLLEYSRLSAALDLASAIAERAEANLDADDPDAVRAAGVKMVTETYMAAFLHRKAPEGRPVAERCRLVLGADDPTTLLVAVVAALELIEKRGVDAGLPSGEIVFSGARMALGRGSAATLRLALHWAHGVYVTSGTDELDAGLAAAAAQLRRPVADATGELGEEHHLVLRGRGMLAIFESFTEDSPDDPEDVVATAADILGMSHPSALALLWANRFRLSHLKRHGPALAASRRAWAAFEQRLGQNDPVTINRTSVVAIDAFHAGEYAEAVRMDELVLAGREQLLGADHDQTARASFELAFDLEHLPEPQVERAVEVTAERWLHAPPDDGSDLTEGWTRIANRIAFNLLFKGQDEEAKAVAERAARSALAMWGPENLETSTARQRLARALFVLDEDDAAAEIAAAEWERVVRLNRINEDAIWTARVLVWCLDARGEHDAAVKIAEQAEPIAEGLLPKGDAATIALLIAGLRARNNAGDLTLGTTLEAWEHIEARGRGIKSNELLVMYLLLNSGELPDGLERLQRSLWAGPRLEDDDRALLGRMASVFDHTTPIVEHDLALIWSTVGLLLEAGANDDDSAKPIAERLAEGAASWDDQTVLAAAPFASTLLERRGMIDESLELCERWVALLERQSAPQELSVGEDWTANHASGESPADHEQAMLAARTALGRMLRYRGQLDRAVDLLSWAFTQHAGGSPWGTEWNMDEIYTTDMPMYMGNLLAHACMERDAEGDAERAFELLGRLAYRCDRAWKNVGAWPREGDGDVYSFSPADEGGSIRYDNWVLGVWKRTRGWDRDRMPDRGATPRSLPSPYSTFVGNLQKEWRGVKRSG